MTSNAPSIADPNTWIAFGSLVVAIASAAASWFSYRNAAHALIISERQERSRNPQLRVYFANGYRKLASNRQIFGMLTSISNPTDIDIQFRVRVASGMQNPRRYDGYLSHSA